MVHSAACCGPLSLKESSPKKELQSCSGRNRDGTNVGPWRSCWMAGQPPEAPTDALLWCEDRAAWDAQRKLVLLAACYGRQCQRRSTPSGAVGGIGDKRHKVSLSGHLPCLGCFVCPSSPSHSLFLILYTFAVETITCTNHTSTYNQIVIHFVRLIIETYYKQKDEERYHPGLRGRWSCPGHLRT